MAARITRAKKKIAAAGIPYVVPDRSRPAAGHGAGRRAPAGHDRPHRAVGRAARARRPGRARPRPRAHAAAAAARTSARSRGLLALLLLLRARAATREDVLEEQDRSLWDTALIAEADALIVGRPAGRPARPLHAPGGDRGPARRGAELRRDRLAAAARALRRAARRLAVPGRRAQPRRRRCPRCTERRRPLPRSRRSTASTPTATSGRPRPTSCAASAATSRPATPTAKPSRLTDNATERAFLEARLG